MRNEVVGIFLLVIGIASSASVPPLPEFYSGYVYVNGELAPAGTEVKVVSDSGDEFAVKTSGVTPGFYQLIIPIDNPDTPADEGASAGEGFTWQIDGKETDTPSPKEDTAVPGNQNYEFNLAIGTIPQPTCSDGIKNQDETDVDCGGPCKPCDGAVTTSLPAKDTTTSLRSTNTTTTVKSFVNNLLSRIKPKTTTSLKTEKQAQTTTIDQTGATCYDGIRNQGEESVDCGGPCKPCKTSLVPWWLILGTVIVLVFIGIILVVGIVLYVKRPWK